MDPQWLCDLLAHIVTVRQINPFVKDGKLQLGQSDYCDGTCCRDIRSLGLFPVVIVDCLII